MTKEWSTTLRLTPVAKAAARVTMQGGTVRKFTPEKTRNAMNDIRYGLIKAGAPMFEGAVSLTVIFYRKRPKSQKKTPFPITRSDLSNYLKGLEDAANGILWRDDAQICCLIAEKRYAEVGSIYIRVEAMKLI